MTMDDATRAAVKRLVDLARTDTGQARRAADFLLAWWNAKDLGGFDLTEAANVDETLAEDMISVFAYVARHPGAVYPDAFEAEIKAVIRQWRPEVWARSQQTA